MGQTDSFASLREEFVTQWGTLGSSWGINRSMAQIHARLLVATAPMSTDEIMEELGISRGNANTNLRELVGWGLIRQVAIRGERKQFFEAEKGIWKMFCTIARERRRRELEPALALLRDLIKRSKRLKGDQVRAFSRQLGALADFVETASGLIDRVVAREQSQVLPALLRLFR